VTALAGRLFQQLQGVVGSPGSDGAALSSIIASCADLRLYSTAVVQACLARSQQLLQRQLQQPGRGGEAAAAGLSGRQLGVLLHGLAVLGLRPSDSWLRLAVTAAGAQGARVQRSARQAGSAVTSRT
jgi:hypothetical protein